MALPRFHALRITRVTPLAAGAVAVAFEIPVHLREIFSFDPGQFITLRATVQGQDLRRNYSICSSRGQFTTRHELEVGIKPVTGGRFSNWALHLLPGDNIDVLPPDGRFTSRLDGNKMPLHRVAFAAGSGITPILSILASSLQSEAKSRFSLVYCNRVVDSIMFNESLQDLKDAYPARLSLIHVLTGQAGDTDLLHGRLDRQKTRQLLDTLLPARDIDEVFICGPVGMAVAVQSALLAAGIAPERMHNERFLTDDAMPDTRSNAPGADFTKSIDEVVRNNNLQIVLDGKTHRLAIGATDKVLGVGLAAGLDLPYACRGGVCCTCRARVLEGKVTMDRNFTLEQWEIDKGFCLTCQARAITPSVTVSYDER